MDKRYNTQNWVGNMYQRFEAVCQEVDEFVHQDKVKYVESHMQTVGESVKKFYSGVVQDILPPLADPVQHVAQLIPSKRIDLVETYTSTVVGIKENTVDSNTNKSDNAALVPTEKCHKPSSTGLCHSVQISGEISGYPIGEADANSFFQQEGDNNINKTSAKTIQVHLNSSTSSQEDFVVDRSLCTDLSSSKDHKDSSEAIIRIRCSDEKCDDDHSVKITRQSSEDHLDNKSFEEEGILCNMSSKIDASVFEDADWGIENIFDLNLGIDEKINGGPSPPCPRPSEDVNSSADKILFPSVEEKSEKVSMETLVSGLGISCSQEKMTLLNSSIDEFESDSNTSSDFKSSIMWDENKEEKDCHIFAGDLLPEKLYDSSSEHDRCNLAPFEPSVFCSKIGEAEGSMVDDVEDLNMQAIDLSDKKQKMIQDAFMSRKRLTKEYKQLVIWYGDIEKEFSEPTEASNMGATPKSPARDLCDSEWEIL
ncbi:hypothetical protein Ccrd_019539 [Cynara cardunculus var. scolymus]|uniref:Uncharacterized protein n=1 Tax=Cynara cardunculus var. scolymus TaxID=59895 RepID=A0A118K133_CYNCS|nr:hypothetical protein Ccrd_019539 [Cynara cardunculus var. scolymus]